MTNSTGQKMKVADVHKPMSSNEGQGESPARSRFTTLVGGSIGHFIEWYEWSVYGLLAALFASQMFPGGNPDVALIASFAAFAIGSIGRPLGAFILSPLADRFGRRNLLTVTIAMAGIGSLIIGICPTYSQIGLAAPLIIVLARFLQGLAAGGEYQIAATFLNEHASPKWRALQSSPQNVAIGLAIMTATAIGGLLTAVLPGPELASWGWRIPFLVGAALSLFGVVMRRGLKEPPAFQAMMTAYQENKITVLSVFSRLLRYPREVLIVFVIQMNGVQYYLWMILLPTYAHRYAGIDQSLAFQGNVIANIAYCIAVPIFAACSDRIGRKPFLIASATCFLCLTYPLLALLLHFQTFDTFLIVAVVGSLFIALNNSVIGSVFVELFPTHVRASGAGIPYAVSAAIFGGTAPLIVTWLQTQGGAFYVALYVMLICFITLATHVFFTPETRSRLL